MTKQDKQLLLKNLCMRLPYGVICRLSEPPWDEIIEPLKIGGLKMLIEEKWDVKPYLRPMSSMTKGEKNRFYSFMEKDSYGFPTDVINKEKIYEYINWLLANHFDFNDLIPKGLAIKITEEDNPYKT